MVGELIVRASDAVSAVVSRFEANIEDGTWKPGFRLPTERELEIELGVARNTLRKGLKRLEAEGRIVRQIGRGSFVSDRVSHGGSKAQNILDRVLGSSPAEVMEIRLVLEPWAGSLAATRATTADLAVMRDCLVQAKAATDIPGFEVWDGKLHEVLIAAAKNELLAGLYEGINMARVQPEWMKLKERTVTPDRRQMFQHHHEEIVEAVCDRDPDLAAERLRVHLLAVRQSLVGF
jgi:DNA-binding FadR family transcriptional regulator